MTPGDDAPEEEGGGDMRTKEGRSGMNNEPAGGLRALEREAIDRLARGERAELEKELADLTGYLDLVQQGEVAETLDHLRSLGRKEAILKRALASLSGNDPMEPSSSRTLSREELKSVAEAIALGLGQLKGQYAHFEHYDPDEGSSGAFPITYRHHVEWVDNPDHEREIRAREAERPLKRPKPDETVATYPGDDSIELFIHATQVDEFRCGQRLWIPDLWICDHAVELIISGRESEALAEIREEVYGLLLDVKARFEDETP